MVKDISIPELYDASPEGIKKWAREITLGVNEVLQQAVNPGAIYVKDGFCTIINTGTTIAGGNEFNFTSPVTGNGSILATIVGAQNVKLALNSTTLTGSLSNTDTTGEIVYERAVNNIVEDFNTLKVWSTGTETAEVKRIEVRAIDSGGWKAYGALANQGTLNSDVQIYEPGDAQTRRIGNGIAFLEVVDGQSVTFDPVRAEIPKIAFIGGGAGMPVGTSITGGAWYREVKAENSSTAGFDVSALFKVDNTSPTNVTDTGATGTTTSWVIEKSATPEDNDNTYTLQYDVQVDAGTEQVIEGETIVIPKQVTIALDTRTTAMGAWTERATATYQNETTSVLNLLNRTKDVIVDGLGADAAFRVRVKSGNGNIQAFDSVKYTHGGTGGASETMTPGNGEQPILVAVYGGGEETLE